MLLSELHAGYVNVYNQVFFFGKMVDNDIRPFTTGICAAGSNKNTQ